MIFKKINKSVLSHFLTFSPGSSCLAVPKSMILTWETLFDIICWVAQLRPCELGFWGEIPAKLHLHLSVVSLGANDILRLKKIRIVKKLQLPRVFEGGYEVCTWAVGCWADRWIKSSGFLEHPPPHPPPPWSIPS